MATTMHAGTTRRGGGANHDGTPPRLTRVHATPRCNSGYPAFDECNVRRLPTLAERRLPSTKRTVVPTDSIGVTQTSCAQNQPTAYSNCDRNRNDDPSPHRAPRKPWCNSGHPASDECNALRLLSVTERRLPSTKRTVARTKSSRTTETSCAQNQPTAYSNYDDDLLTLPGSHASLGAIPAIMPSTDATESVFQR